MSTLAVATIARWWMCLIEPAFRRQLSKGATHQLLAFKRCHPPIEALLAFKRCHPPIEVLLAFKRCHPPIEALLAFKRCHSMI
jgi:hypothetical protein